MKYSITSMRQMLQELVLQIIIPITVVGSIWIAPLKHIEILALPFLGAFTILFGGFSGYILSKPLRLNREQRGVYTVAGGNSDYSGSNHGTWLIARSW